MIRIRFEIHDEKKKKNICLFWNRMKLIFAHQYSLFTLNLINALFN